jgi:hypothetical protein
MPVSANARSAADPAPGALELVQELLNTASNGPPADPRPDLLADREAALDWLTGRHFPDAVDEVAQLRRTRDDLRAAIRARDGHPAGPTEVDGQTATVALVLNTDGSIDIRPGSLTGLVLAEVRLAQERGDWARLKLCAFDICSTAYFDRTRNLSSRFHTPRCANYVNLRASRERRRSES